MLRKEVHDRRPRVWFAAARNLAALALWRGRFWTSRARVDRSAGCRRPESWWQSLPLGPTGYGNITVSTLVFAHAGNGLLVSPDWLMEDGLIQSSDCQLQSFPETEVDYNAVIPFKYQLLEKAWANFQAASSADLRVGYEQFCKDQAHWLNDYALFRALKAKFGGAYYLAWPKELVEARASGAGRRPARIGGQSGTGVLCADSCYYRQADRLKAYAHDKSVKLIGDLPFFVSPDSKTTCGPTRNCSCWMNIAARVSWPVCLPIISVRAGTALGQSRLQPGDAQLRSAGYRWCIGRLRALLAHVDVIRLDHFRAFAAAWHIPMPAREPRRWEIGCPVQAPSSSTPWNENWALCRSSPKIWG